MLVAVTDSDTVGVDVTVEGAVVVWVVDAVDLHVPHLFGQKSWMKILAFPCGTTLMMYFSRHR